jgi:hypothetical protein
MNDREKFIIRAALLFLQSNLEDANESYNADDYDDDDWEERQMQSISVNGDFGKAIEENEVAELLMTLQ